MFQFIVTSLISFVAKRKLVVDFALASRTGDAALAILLRTAKAPRRTGDSDGTRSPGPVQLSGALACRELHGNSL